MSRSLRVREFTRVSKASRVDRDAGIIYGLAILGPDSANGRHYSETAMRSALGLYENRVSNANHLRQGGEPSVYDRIGVWHSPFFESGIIKGNFAVLKSHPLAERLFEAAERPELHSVFGFSHDASGQEKPGSNGSIIVSIDEVFSVDLVADPATVGGIWESINRNRRTNMRKRTRENEGIPDTFDIGTPGAGGGSDGDVLSSACDMLQQLVDNAGSRHDTDYIDDLKEALSLLTPWVDGDGATDTSSQESRRRAAAASARRQQAPLATPTDGASFVKFIETRSQQSRRR